MLVKHFDLGFLVQNEFAIRRNLNVLLAEESV